MDSNERNRRSKADWLKYFLTGLAGAVLGLFLFTLLGYSRLFYKDVPKTMPQQNSSQTPIQYDKTGLLGSSGFTSAAQKVIPSVVGITISKIEDGKMMQGVGSGIIVDSAGYILTNNHVAGGNLSSMVVSLYDGRNINGTTVWADPVLDLAVVKVGTSGLPAAVLGDSKGAAPGQQAIAIGNPLGLTLQRTVTAGVISAVNRTIEVEQGVFMEGLLQTDASINPGNSGGPLINTNGEVIGVNTVKVTSAEGLGFAVPINVAKPIVDRIKSTGGFSTPVIAMQTLDRDMGGLYNFTLNKGVYVYDCSDGGCAYKSGIRKGEAVLAVNDKPIDTASEFREELYRAAVSDTVRLKIRGINGVERDVYVKLYEVK